jgi:two-component system sensor kinase FixL
MQDLKIEPPEDELGLQSAGLRAGGEALASESVDLLMTVLDMDGLIVSCNPAFSRILGHELAALRGAAMAELIVAEADRGAFQNALFGTGDEPGGKFGEGDWLTAHGKRLPVRWWLGSLVSNRDGARYFVVTGLDLTGTRKARDQIAEREARLQAILDTAVDGIITIDDHGIIDSANSATEEMFGYRAEEIIGHNVKELMPDSYRRNHDGYIDAYLKTGDKKIIGIGREVEGQRKDGSSFPLDLSVSEFIVAGERRFMGLMRDISERKRVEQEARFHLDELAHAARLSALGEMATGIAHEVNQPLAAIVSYAQACLNMIASKNPDESLIKDALEQIASQGRRAGDIIHRLRHFVRKGQPERSTVDVNLAVKNVLALFGHELKSSGVELSLKLGSGLPQVIADRVQVEQVVLNLISNAIEALAQQPSDRRQVTIMTRPANGQGVEVSVTDSGRVLTGESTEQLFETFYTTKPHGMGVGLSISRSIIEAHGGKLWAENNPHGGLEVRFTLPEQSAGAN